MKIYKVTMKVAYHDVVFNFKDSRTAVSFMDIAMSHIDDKSAEELDPKLTMEIINDGTEEEDDF